MGKVGVKLQLNSILTSDSRLKLELLPNNCNTKYISITGQDGSGKTTLRDNLAEYFASKGKTVITAKSPCDPHVVHMLNHAISQREYKDWYTEQLLFSFMDGVLSNYMIQLKGKCDYFICQRGPIDQYAHGITRSEKSYEEIYNIQRPERLAKFDAYVHLNCQPQVAWERICKDEEKDRYEYLEYFAKQVPNTKDLYDNIVNGNQKELDFLRESAHYYIETTKMNTDEVMAEAMSFIEKNIN